MRALSSLEISQAWGVKGLSWLSRVSTFALRHCLSLFHICCCSYCSLVDLEKGLSLSHCSWKTVCGRVWRTPTSSFPWPSQLKILLSSTSCLGRTVMTTLCRRRLAGRKVHEICTVSSAVNFSASPSLPQPPTPPPTSKINSGRINNVLLWLSLSHMHTCTHTGFSRRVEEKNAWRLVQFSSVQFSSRGYLCARKSPLSQKFPQHHLLLWRLCQVRKVLCWMNFLVCGGRCCCDFFA